MGDDGNDLEVKDFNHGNLKGTRLERIAWSSISVYVKKPLIFGKIFAVPWPGKVGLTPIDTGGLELVISKPFG